MGLFVCTVLDYKSTNICFVKSTCIFFGLESSMQTNQPQSISIGIEVRCSHVVLLRVTHSLNSLFRSTSGWKKENISTEKSSWQANKKNALRRKDE